MRNGFSGLPNDDYAFFALHDVCRTVLGEYPMYDFQERIDSQKEYYEQFKDWLAGQKNVARVWDADFEDDLKGTDLFFETINGDVFAVQVKVYHRADGSGNLPFETISQAYGSQNSVALHISCFIVIKNSHWVRR